MESFPPHRVLNRRRANALRSRRAAPQGFTLIEMLVVLVIIVIVTAIALSGQSGFNRTEALNNIAYDMGLSIRQAESYGLANSINGVGAGGDVNVPYGISLNINSPALYYLFADTSPDSAANCGSDPKPDCAPGNHEYDSSSDKIAQTYNLNNGFKFKAFCAMNSSKTSCTSDAGSSPLKLLSITFGRPNAQTTIAGKNTQDPWETKYTYACVKIASPDGDARYVGISANGQVQAGVKGDVDPNNICP